MTRTRKLLVLAAGFAAHVAANLAGADTMFADHLHAALDLHIGG